MSTDAVMVDNVKYNYGDIQAVKGITFTEGKRGQVLIFDIESKRLDYHF